MNSPASRFSERNGNPVSSSFCREDFRSAEERKSRRFEDRRSPENFRADSSRESGRRFEDRRFEDRRASGKPYAGSARESALPPEERNYKDFEYRRDPETFHAVPERESGRYEDRRSPERFHAGPAGEEPQDHILCGRNPIREALRSGREIEKLLVQKGELNGSAREIVQEARERKIMVQETDRRRLDEIAPHHQGLIAFASAYAYAEVDDLLEEAERRGEDPFLILLDGVTDPHNLGAIIRTAECAGAHGVIIPTHRSVGLTPAAVKASAGAVEHIRVARVMNLNRTIEDLKSRGIWTYAVTMNGKDFEKVDFHGGTALVIGAEGEGISRLTAEKCDLSVSLPLRGKLDSLNASVAAGIIMYRVLCCRRHP